MSENRRGEESAGSGIGNATDSATGSMTWVVRPDPDLEDLIPSFMNNRRNDVIEIRQALGRSDYEHIQRTAHTLKGICRPYGFGQLEMLSKELEVAAQSEDTQKVGQIADEMQGYLENVRVVYDDRF